MKIIRALTIQEVEKLLLDNNFVRMDAENGDWHCEKTDLSYVINWGHSDIRSYKRNDERINVQYQHVHNENDLTNNQIQDEVWSFIFGDLPLHITVAGFDSITNREILYKYNFIEANQHLNTYEGFSDLKSVVELCKFAKNIDLKLKKYISFQNSQTNFIANWDNLIKKH